MSIYSALPYIFAIAAAAVAFLAVHYGAPLLKKHNFNKLYEKRNVIKAVLCIACAIGGWFLAPQENDYSAAEKKDWAARQAKLNKSEQWKEFRRNWYELNDLVNNYSIQDDSKARIEQVQQNIEKILDSQDLAEINDREALALKRLANYRVAVWKQEMPDMSPRALKVLLDKLSGLEGRFRLLSIVKSGGAADKIIWHERVRMAKDIYMFDVCFPLFYDTDINEKAFDIEYPYLDEMDFSIVGPDCRSLGLLLVDASSYMSAEEKAAANKSR
ncbi:MAG: hypothetical protein K6G50_04710 [bacterium]|nr:hypothetical protein [bacterium]